VSGSLRVRVPRFIPSDMPEAFPAAFIEPGEYAALSNPHGAISVFTERGWIGVRPGEFEWVEGHMPSAEQMAEWLWGGVS